MFRNQFIALFAGVVSTTTLVGQDWAKASIEQSPRHLEWVVVKQGTREVKSFLAFPEVKEKAPAVIVIHEIFGLSDWVQSATDQFAAAGYIAIAPDLLSGMAPGGGGSKELGSEVRSVIGKLKPDQITADLDAVVDYVSKLPACNGKVAVAGFCWGGGQTFRFATNNKKIKAALPFYGSGPNTADAIKRIECPVFGFYGENDMRVNATIEKSTELMKAAEKKYEPVYYAGAGHGFMRAGQAPDASAENKKGRDDAWKRIKKIMAEL